MGLSTQLDWGSSMKQSFSWYIVNPTTWQDDELLYGVSDGARISYDLDADTCVSGSIEYDGEWGGEFVLRGYLDAEQGNVREHIPLATLVCQTPRIDIDGRVGTVKVDGVGSLIYLADERLGFGWSVPAGSPCVDVAATIADELTLVPVVAAQNGTAMADPWTAGDDDTALDVVRSLCAAGGHELTCDQWGRYAIQPSLRTSALSPVATVSGDGAGVLLPGVTAEADWYGLPNVVQVVWSEPTRVLMAEAVNDDPDSVLSTVSRGRRVVERMVNPDGLASGCSPTAVSLLAQTRLSEVSCVERTLEYDRGFDPRISLGDCVRVEWRDFGVSVTGRVIRQDIMCETGATVHETVRWTERM